MRPARAAALVLLLLVPSGLLSAQIPEPVRPMSGAELDTAIRKLPVLRSALYIAAHPDDENTAMITWLGNEKLARAGYLVMTRGDGGQNLIGGDIGPKLGVIRTWELLRAREIDGGHQFFTRAIDFGYSKSSEETLAIWGHREILRDVVRIIRDFRPDVLITRFPVEADTHGHHTASAILANEAFRLAGDPSVFPDLGLPPWQPKRIFWNTWQPDSAEPGTVLAIDLGGYDPLRGESWPEVAARSRTMHKSQGFGAGGSRGPLTNHLVLTGGDAFHSGIFDGIESGWERVEGSERVAAIFDRIVSELDITRPAMSIPALIEARRELRKLPESHWVLAKREDLDRIILSAAGVWIEALADRTSVVPGQSLDIAVTAVARTAPASFSVAAGGESILIGSEAINERSTARVPLTVAPDAEPSQPWWLREPPLAGRHQLADPSLLGAPASPAPLSVPVAVGFAGETIEIEVPVLRREVDPVHGEIWDPVLIVPHVTVGVEPSPLLVPGQGARTTSARITLANNGAPVSGRLRLSLPDGWRIADEAIPLSLDAGETRTREIEIAAPDRQSTGALRAAFDSNEGTFDRSMSILEYDHIPRTAVFEPSETKLVRIPLEVTGERVGYIAGSGDAIPAALEALGFEVVTLTPSFSLSDLEGLDALVLGIRALNVHDDLGSRLAQISGWVSDGGRVIVQYNTAGRSGSAIPFPDPLAIGRDRVTVEEAPVRLLREDHPLLVHPNRITPADFEGWVQERGLYFASSWSDRWQPVLGMTEPGESEVLGSLLVLPQGEGAYIYTGISFFRQLPAGVPGAWRLFANMVSGGSDD